MWKQGSKCDNGCCRWGSWTTGRSDVYEWYNCSMPVHECPNTGQLLSFNKVQMQEHRTNDAAAVWVADAEPNPKLVLEMEYDELVAEVKSYGWEVGISSQWHMKLENGTAVWTCPDHEKAAMFLRRVVVYERCNATKR